MEQVSKMHIIRTRLLYYARAEGQSSMGLEEAVGMYRERGQHELHFIDMSSTRKRQFVRAVFTGNSPGYVDMMYGSNYVLQGESYGKRISSVISDISAIISLNEDAESQIDTEYPLLRMQQIEDVISLVPQEHQRQIYLKWVMLQIPFLKGWLESGQTI